MGRVREDQSTAQTKKATPEETELNKLDLELRRATQNQLIGVQQQGLSLAETLLQGRQLPGELAGTGGISEEQITDISRSAVRDISPGLQAQGILQSGIGASVQGRVAGDVRRGAAEFNVGAKQNLLNLALGGQAQVQGPSLQAGAQFGERLAGLRSVSEVGQLKRPQQRSFLFGAFSSGG